MRWTRLVWFVVLVCLTGCSPAARQRIATVAAAATQGMAQGYAAQTAKLMVFGGHNHQTYLGCLNCSQYATDSLRNQYGQYGNQYSVNSIWNQFSQFGSQFSMYSACNPYATDPPVIVDQNGAYYGRLSVNVYHPQLGVGSQLQDWLKGVCR